MTGVQTCALPIYPFVFGQDGGGGLTPQLGSATAIQYRNRGVQALLSSRTGRWSYGVGIGYDQRRLLVPATSVLAVLDGSKDESYYLFMTAGRELDADSTLGLSGFVNYFDNGALGAADIQSAGLSASYSRRLWRNLTGNASAAINAFDQDGFNSRLIGSAFVGLRYAF